MTETLPRADFITPPLDERKQQKMNPPERHAPPHNLNELLDARVRATPDKNFLFSEADKRSWTYARFANAVECTARMLTRCGVKRGDVVSLLLPNSAEYVVAYFACFRLGALAGPINSLLKAEEIAFVLNNSEACVLLVHPEFAAAAHEARTHAPRLRDVIEFADVDAANAEFAVTTSDENIAVQAPALVCDDEAIIIYTSGTTGRPKGCLLTHGNLLANAEQITEWLNFTPHDRLLTIMPLFHMNAVMVTTISALYAGASSVVSPRFSASRFWQTVADFEVTSFGSVATMLSMLLARYPEGVPAGLDISRLRFALCGSAPVPAAVIERFEATFNCLVIEGYGLSESTVRATFNPPDTRRRPGSCGLPIGNELRIVNEKEKEVGVGEAGEIVLRGANVFKGYFKNPEATTRAFRGGWFHTGDVGYKDADGFCYVVDRISDMIIRAGENIYPREIDEVLFQHEAVAAAATIGVPDELYGEEVAAFVVLRESREVSAHELLDFCRARLADFKCPKTIRFVVELPKGPTGKVLKRLLAERYATDEGRG